MEKNSIPVFKLVAIIQILLEPTELSLNDTDSIYNVLEALSENLIQGLRHPMSDVPELDQKIIDVLSKIEFVN